MRFRNIFRRRRRDDKPASIDHRVPEDSIKRTTFTTYSPKLPDDIIYELFEAAALAYPPRALVMMPSSAQALARTHTLLGWIILTHVCRSWRQIGLSATLAHLWARVVCLSWKPSVAMELWQRARGCPVTIDLTRYNGMERVFVRHHQLVDWALQHITNVGVLIAPSDLVTVFNRPTLDSPILVLPTLREIQLDRRYSDLPASIEWEAPGLRCARLDMVFLPNHMAQSLRELHLRVYTGRMHLLALHDFLRSCSLLEDLDINVIGEWSDREERPYNQSQLEYLKQAKVVVGADQTAVDVWKPILGPVQLEFSLVVVSDKWASLPRPRILLDACAREMDSGVYDKMEVCMLDSTTGRNDLRLRLCSSSTPASCEVLFPTDETTRATLLSLLPSYLSTTSAHIQHLTLHSLIPDTTHVDRESFRALGRALTGVVHLELRGMDYWSAAMHVRMLRQTRRAPILPALQTLRISHVHLPDIQEGSELEMMTMREWWDTVRDALSTREKAGLGSVRRFVLDGVWMRKRSWIEGEDDRQRKDEMRADTLVGELVDERLWID
ncbi:hypothetical protein PENSPDRAFT_656849 [Peniophora sp. CONT]|nr:hypothetical protein PENSPDRAFT_656849 [Peniophora sp. CONT]